ncbi:MAG: rhomboid family intramembrane serine protease [Lachnospiraceae bacterium]
MYNEIASVFNQMGYAQLKLNVEEPHVNVKLVGNGMSPETEGYVIVTLDETSGIKYTEEQFRHISWQIREFLVHKGCHLYHFLYIFISKNTTPPFNLQNTGECLWRIDPVNLKLIVYGNALPMYTGLKKPIEEFLMSCNMPGNTAHNPYNNYTQYNNVLAAHANMTLVIINIIIFIITDFITPLDSGSSLTDKGALSWELVINWHEYYRIFTYMFLHAGPDHIFNNMVVLLFIGSYIEQYAGKIKYLIIYFSSGIIAGCASMVYNMVEYNYTQSVGASGAIFGLMGSLLCIILANRHNTQEFGLRRVLFMVFLSLYGGITSQGVDNAAHIGGFLGGFLITWFILAFTGNSKRKAGMN